MKKWLGYLLTVYILLCAVVPCSIVDNCNEEQCTETNADGREDADCKNCSPFSACASCNGFTSNIATTVNPPAFYATPLHTGYHFIFESRYHSRFFQPPRS